jgi:class 3 adenylate cyclase
VHPLITHISNKPSSDFSVSKPFSCDLSTFVVTLNGKTLQLALKTSESLKLLVLLMFVAKTVCFYEMFPHHMRLLDKIMKKCLSFKPTCASFGDGIGFRLNASSCWNQTSHCEVSGRSTLDIKELILHLGLNIYLKSSKVLKLSVFTNAVLGSVLFLNCYFSNFSTFSVVSQENVYFFVFLVQILVHINQLAADTVFEKNLLGQFRMIYLTGSLSQESSFSALLVFALSGVVVGMVSFVLMTLTFVLAVDDQGRNYSTSEIDFFLLLVISLAMQVCMFLDCQKVSIKTIILAVVTVAVIFTYLIIMNFKILIYLQSLDRVFGSPSLVLSLVMNVVLVSTVYYGLLRWKELFKPTLIDYYRSAKAYFSVLEFKSRQGEFEEDLSKVYSFNTLADNTSASIENPLDKILMVFKSQTKEKEYNKEKVATYRRTYKVNFLVYFAIVFSLFVYTGIVEKTEDWQRGLLFSAIFLVTGSFLMMFTRIYLKSSMRFIGFLYVSGVFYTVIGIILQYDTFSTFYSLYPLIFMINCTHWLRLTVPLSLLLLILDVQFKTKSISSKTNLISYALCETSIFIVSILCSYLLDYHKRQEFLLVSQVSLKTSKANDVLRLLLPSFVISKVKTGIYYISIDQGIVSVLFCNICNFEELTSDLTPMELTSFLDELYSKFDQLCEIVGVTKIETVGKTYMASAGIKDSEMELDSYLSSISHARRLVELALGMIRAIQKTHLKGSRVQIKIGINSGPVRAGVVGFHKPQFSLVGDTVNIASRMASTLTEYNSIQVTQETYEIIKDSPELSFVGQTSLVKGKGEMATFIVKVASDNSNSEISPSIGDTYGSGLKGQFLSCKVSTSYLSLSAAYSVEPVARSSFSKKSRVSAMWKKKSTLHKKTSQVISKVRFFPCSSKARKKEKKFRIRNLDKKVKNFYIALISAIFCYSGLLIAEGVLMGRKEGNLISLVVCALVVVSYSGFLPLIQKYHKTTWFSYFYSSLLLFPVIFHVISDIHDPYSSTTVTSLKISFHILLLTQCSSLQYSHSFLISLFILLLLLILQISKPSQCTTITFLFLLLSQMSCYSNEVKLRIYSKLQSTSQKDLSKLENLLTQMVPPHAYEHLKAENSVIDKFYQVTLLYADIVGFTAWSSTREPAEVVTMLNEMFTRFDKMCVSHSVYKVHTIGDCYVAMGNAGSGNRDIGQECVNVMKFAHAMINTIQQVNIEYSMGINMRIGVHTGDVIAGITGKSIVRYDIYGNDVFIANSMESNGLAGHVAVSKTTMNLLKNFRPSLMSFDFHKIVEVFGEDIEVFFARFN